MASSLVLRPHRSGRYADGSATTRHRGGRVRLKKKLWSETEWLQWDSRDKAEGSQEGTEQERAADEAQVSKTGEEEGGHEEEGHETAVFREEDISREEDGGREETGDEKAFTCEEEIGREEEGSCEAKREGPKAGYPKKGDQAAQPPMKQMELF